ncbi:MAG: hypothetical protein U0168_03755 [Nannocystaceae bacterium]|jgi:hypothetical protein
MATVAGGAWLLASLVCSSPEANAPGATPPGACAREAVRPSPPPLTTLRTRDAEVAIYGIDGALRYTVIDVADGRVLAHHVAAREFVQRFPTLAAHVEHAFADDDTWLDASVTAPSRPRGSADVAP